MTQAIVINVGALLACSITVILMIVIGDVIDAAISRYGPHY